MVLAWLNQIKTAILVYYPELKVKSKTTILMTDLAFHSSYFAGCNFLNIQIFVLFFFPHDSKQKCFCFGLWVGQNKLFKVIM